MASAMHPLGRRQSQTGQQGSATDEESNSLSGMISTLIPALIIASIFFVIFLLLRRRERRQYQPRTYVGTLRKEELTPEPPQTLFGWVGAFYKIPDTYVLNHHSLDGYLLLRYLRIAVVMCLVGCLLTWPLLFPINATGGNGNKQLDLLHFGNVSDARRSRFYAHALISCLFFGFILYMITRESIFYINLRQAYLTSPLYAKRLSSRTVLFTSVPEHYLNEERLRYVYGSTVKNVWICTDCKDIEDLAEERDKVAMKLEGAETKLVKLANAARLKSQKGGASHDAHGSGYMADEAGDAESGLVASRWVDQKKRPTHRLTPIIGNKVDTINWSRSELARLVAELDKAREVHVARRAKLINAVFIEFHTQAAAEEAYQTLAHHQPLHMAPRYIGIRPEDVIWKNLKIKWWERIIRAVATTAIVTAMVVFWGIPVAAVGAISNVDALIEKLPWLGFINDIPTAVRGVVTGLLPVVLLIILIALVPVIMRTMAKLGGAPSKSQVELTVQNSYFTFQVVQVFLITTLSSAASAVVVDIINDPSSAPSLLARSIPKASNFYIAYFILRGLAMSSSALVQIAKLILNKILGKILDSTPRKVYNRWANLTPVKWGSIFPVLTNLMVIALTYSCIAPLVLGFAAIGFYLLYFAWRYNLIYVLNASVIDTKGLVYPRALQQTLTGVYLAEISLIGLFGIARAPGPLVIEVVALVFTVLYHYSLHNAISPHLKYLPKTLASEEETLLLNGGDEEKMYGNGGSAEKARRVLSDDAQSPTKKPSFFAKWLRPDKYCSYQTLRRLVPRNFPEIVYSLDDERNAYFHPAISSPTPLIWMPRDDAGVSRQEVRHTSKFTPATDEGAWLNEKNKIMMNQEEKPPVHEVNKYF